ncbi:MAG: hypothetical protein Q8Q08_10245 [Candidatus Omnitrophota bacterium]|nr:hypothetical protein [Candidatus Omnitrophota bacterium]MDZ4241586.1 hypothetical protein [Candidatus Omnitrophota bacterium]
MFRVFNITALFMWAAVFIFTAARKPLMRDAFLYSSYYIIFALTVSWAYSLVMLWREKSPRPPQFFRTHWRGLAFSFVLASIVFVSVPKQLRVLNDETNLLSVGKSMMSNRNVHNIMEGQRAYGRFWPLEPALLEKRPLLFPFFVSLAHTVSGYRVENVFAFNYFVLWAVLFLLYWLVRPGIGEAGAAAGLLLVMSQPIMSWCATSGGFELFNFLFILISFILLRSFLRAPGGAVFLALVLSLAMLGNIRYESPVFFVVTMVILAAAGYVRREYLPRPPVYVLTPFFFLPWLWQRALMLTEKNYDFPGRTWLQELQLENASRNSPAFFKYVLGLNGELGYAGLVNCAGILAAVYFAVLFFKNLRRRPVARPDAVLWATVSLCLLIVFAGALSFCHSIAVHPFNGRYYMALLVILSVLPVFVLVQIFRRKGWPAAILLTGALALFLYYHGAAVEDRWTNSLYATRELRFITDFLKKNADENTLVICDRPGQLIVHGYGAEFPGTANKDVLDNLRAYKSHMFSSIYVIQPVGRSPWPSQALDRAYQLEPIVETRISDEYSLRISKVKISD